MMDGADTSKLSEDEQYECRLIQVAKMPEVHRDKGIHQVYLDYKHLGYKKASIQKAVNSCIQAQQLEALERQGPGIIERLNNQYFVMESDSKTRIGSIKKRKVNGKREQTLSLLTKTDFALKMANRITAGTTADEIWLAHPERKEYEGFFTDPKLGKEVDGALNLWDGFNCEPKKGCVKLFLEHVKNLSDADEAINNYILDWLAWTFQHPELPIGVVLVFIGEQGSGKGMLGNFIAHLHGAHGVTIRTQNALVGKHNVQLMAACFAFIDEALFSGNKQVADVLKGLVTEPTIRIEPKFQDSFEVRNLLSMIAASNHDHAMQVEYSDRRYMVQGVPECMTSKGVEYYKKLHDRLYSDAGAAAVLHYLLNRDVSKFHAQRDRPVTEFYLSQKMASLSDDNLWWRHVAERQTFAVGGVHVDWDKMDSKPASNGSSIVEKVGLYDTYCRWAEDQRYGNPVDSGVFFRNANKWLLSPPDYIRSGKRGEQVRKVTIPPFSVIEQRLKEFLTKKR